MNRNRIGLWVCGILAVATVTISYATCYALLSEPVCVTAGQCYGQCTPQGCSQSTCIIATQTGYELGQVNVYPSAAGTWQSRADSGFKNTCKVGGCKVWNNCSQCYEYSPINGCSCDQPVPRFTVGLPGPCQ
jgi:hypothetical protein